MKQSIIFFRRRLLRPWAILLFLGLNALGNAQETPRHVVGAAGGYYEDALFGTLCWTVGEVAVSHFQNGIELCEGFHQANYPLEISEREYESQYEPVSWEVELYPNPTAGWLQIKLPFGEGFSAQLFSSFGQLVWAENGLRVQHQLNLEALPAGIYWLRLASPDGQSQSYQIQKI